MKTNITRRINSELMFQGRLQRERACLKGVTLCSMGLALPVTAYLWLGNRTQRVASERRVNGLEMALNVAEVV